MLPEIIYISRNGQMLGSFHRDAIKAGLANHTYLPDDLAWYEGASGWAPLNTLEGFDTPPASPPPVPSITPPLPPPVTPPIPPAVPSAPPPIPPPSATAPAPRPPITGTAPKKRGCTAALIFLALLALLFVVGGGVAAYKFGLWETVSLRLKAGSGNTDAMVDLARRYQSKQNFPEAVRWFRKASDAGNTEAEVRLANLLTWKRSGLPPPQYQEAMRLYLKACDQGNTRGCERAAFIYDTGWFDFPKDANEARRLYAKAKELKPASVPKPSARASEPAVINPSSSSGTELQATEFYRAFTNKPSESDALYKNKTLTLVGAVDTASVNPMGQVFVLLKAGGSNYVTCTFPATAKSTVTSLREGQNVKIRGQCTGLVYGTFSLRDCTLVR
jgi:tetratricopeptide (TPR) repeat protein